MLLSQYTGGSNAGTQGSGTNNGGTLSGSDLWLLYSAGLGAGSSSSGASGNSSSNLLTLLSQYQGGSSVVGQGNGTGNTLSNADLWGMYWSGAGAGSSSASTDEGSLADYATISAQYTGGSGIGGITPLVYNPESDGPPVFYSGVFTGDHGSVQFVQTADTGNQGTGEGDTSQSDGKSRARSWWGIRGWFLGDEPIDDGGSQVIPTSEGGNAHDDGAPDGEPQGNPSPLRLPRNTGWSQFTSMGEPGWGDDVPVFRPGDIDAARGLTGLAKMVHDHGAPISSQAVDSAGRVIKYTFADGTQYLQPVEPPSEQYIDSAAAMIPGGIALKSGKGAFVASGAVMTEVIEDTITNRASEAASQATGGYVSFFPPGVLAALLSGKLKPRAPDADAVGEVIEGTARETGEIAHHSSRSAARRAARREAGMGKHGGVEQLPDQPLRPGSQAPTGPRGTRTEVQSTDTGDIVHHDPYGTRYQDGSVTPPHYGVDRDGQPTTHHTYPSPHDPRTNR